MKWINKYTLSIALFAGVISACNNDLDEKLYSDVSEQSYNYTDAYKAIGIV